jgi:hypothetical protein
LFYVISYDTCRFFAHLYKEALAEYNFTKKQRRDVITKRKALSFLQKEKWKRDMSQSSKGKYYVEEEKRLLRDQRVYLGFDT